MAGDRVGHADTRLAGQGRREIRTAQISVARILCQHLGNDSVEVGQLGPSLTDLRGRRGQVLADDDRRTGVLIRRDSGQQLKSGAAKRILIDSPVDV